MYIGEFYSIQITQKHVFVYTSVSFFFSFGIFLLGKFSLSIISAILCLPFWRRSFLYWCKTVSGTAHCCCILNFVLRSATSLLHLEDKQEVTLQWKFEKHFLSQLPVQNFIIDALLLTHILTDWLMHISSFYLAWHPIWRNKNKS